MQDIEDADLVQTNRISIERQIGRHGHWWGEVGGGA